MKKIVYLIFGIIFLLGSVIAMIISSRDNIVFLPWFLLSLFLGVSYLLFGIGKKEINKKSDLALKLGIWGLGINILCAVFLFIFGLLMGGLNSAIMLVMVWSGFGSLILLILCIIAVIFALLAIFKKQ
jgi:hypothetical protein